MDRKNKNTPGKIFLTVFLSIVSVVYVMPILIILINSFKSKTAISSSPFSFPNADSFYGFKNYIEGKKEIAQINAEYRSNLVR